MNHREPSSSSEDKTPPRQEESEKGPSLPTSPDSTEEGPLLKGREKSSLGPRERNLALIHILIKEDIISQEKLHQSLSNSEWRTGASPYSLEQRLVKEGLLTVEDYLILQDKINEITGLCSQCQATAYRLLEEEDPLLCTQCLTEKKSGETQSVQTESLAYRMEILENISPGSSSGLVGRVIDDCEILEELGRGGMGVVYRGYQPRLDRTVALKVILESQSENPRRIQRFLREARAMATLRHPHIVNIYDIGFFQGQYYFTMDFVEGRSLHEMIQKKELSAHHAVRIARDLAYAVDYAHSQGVVHRDLKPSNIMIDSNGRPLVMDFGLAKILDKKKEEKITHTGAVVGTPLYMAPEQITSQWGEIDGQTDVFALGGILYEMIGGEPPFQADSHVEVYERILNSQPTDLRKLNPLAARDIDTICQKALYKDKRRRYQSGRELAADLDRFLNDQPIHARRQSWGEKTVRYLRRHPLGTAVAILFFLFLAGLFYREYTRPGQIELLSLSGEEKIYIDGRRRDSPKEKEKSLLLSLPAGKYDLEIRRKKWKKYEKKITLQRGSKITLLPKMKRKKGYLTLRSTPTGAQVTVLQKGRIISRGETPWKKKLLPTGKYEIKVARDNYGTRHYSLEIQEGKATSLDTSLFPLLEWQFESTLDLHIRGIGDFTNDGYGDLLYREGRYLHIWDGAEKKKVSTLYREGTIFPGRRRTEFLEKFDLGNPSFYEPFHFRKSQEVYLLEDKKKSYFILTEKKRARLFDLQGRRLRRFHFAFYPDLNHPRRGFFLSEGKVYGKKGKEAGYHLASLDLEGKKVGWQKKWREEELRDGKNFSLPQSPSTTALVAAGKYILAFQTKTGHLFWAYPLEIPLAGRSQKLGKNDINGDGYTDLAFWEKGKIKCLSGKTGKVLSRWEAQLHPTSPVYLIDRDGDGSWEVVAFDDRGKLKAWKKGESREVLPAVTREWKAPRLIKWVELTGDSHLDLVFAHKNRMIAISGRQGQSISSFIAPDPIEGEFYLGDLDWDGNWEVVFSTSRGIYCTELDQKEGRWYDHLGPRGRYLGRKGAKLKRVEGEKIVTYHLPTGKKEENRLPQLKEKFLLIQSPHSGPELSYILVKRDHLEVVSHRGKTLQKATLPHGIPAGKWQRLSENAWHLAGVERRGENSSQYFYRWQINSRVWGLLQIVPAMTYQEKKGISIVKIQVEPEFKIEKIFLPFPRSHPHLFHCPPKLWEREPGKVELVFTNRSRSLYRIPLHEKDLRVVKKEISQKYWRIPRDFKINRDDGDGEVFYILESFSLRKISLNGEKREVKFSWRRLLRHLEKEFSLKARSNIRWQLLEVTPKKRLILMAFNFGDPQKKERKSLLIAFDFEEKKICWARDFDGEIRQLKRGDTDGQEGEEIAMVVGERVEILGGKEGRLLVAFPLEEVKLLNLVRIKGKKTRAIVTESKKEIHYFPVSDFRNWNRSPQLRSQMSRARALEGDFRTDLVRFYDSIEGGGKIMAHLEQLERNYPQEEILSHLKIQCYLRRGDYQKCLEVLNRLSPVQFNDNLLYYRARAHYGLGQYIKALMWIEQLLRKGTSHLSWRQGHLKFYRLRKEILKKIEAQEKKSKKK